MKKTHAISITTGSISGLTAAVLLVGSVLGWDLTDKVAMISGVLALLVNAMFAIITTVKLPPKVEKVVQDVANEAKTIETGIEDATASATTDAAAPTAQTTEGEVK